MNLHLLLLRQLHEIVQHVVLGASVISAPFVNIFSRSANTVIVKVAALALPITAKLLCAQVGKISISREWISGAEVVIKLVGGCLLAGIVVIGKWATT